MWVTRLRLTDFRSYEEADLSLTKGVTTFLGENGQGKTNLVEAVGYVSLLGSHRVATDAPLVRSGSERAIVGVEVARDDRSVLIEIEINPGRANRARINRSPVPRAREVLGLLRTVVFAPEDLALVKGDPSDRRRFLDDLLVQRSPRMLGVKSDYDRILKQRNALLKSARAARRSAGQEMARTLEVWDEQLATVGGELTAERVRLVDDLRPHLQAAYSLIAGGADAVSAPDVVVGYSPSIGKDVEVSTDREIWRDLLMGGIEQRRSDELDRGITLVGPHRDDLLLELGGCPPRVSPRMASRGRWRWACDWPASRC